MKRVIRKIIAAAVLAWSLAAPGAPARAEEVQVIHSGKYYGTVDAYRVGDFYYLWAKDAARLFGGQVYWYAVRGEVKLSFRGKPVLFRTGSDEVVVNGKKGSMPREALARVSRAYIPIEFFSSREFADVAGAESKFNPKTRLLVVNQQSTVGPMRWFSYKDYTRIVVELDADLRFRADKRGLRGLLISIPNGTIDWAERTEIADGVVEEVQFFQAPGGANLGVRLGESAKDWQVREFEKPRRIVIDVFRSSEKADEDRARLMKYEAPAPPEGRYARWLRDRREKKLAKRAAKAAEKTAAAAAAAATAAAGSAGKSSPVPAAVPEARPEPPIPPAKPAPPPGKPFKIVIDPGHGGKDGGAVGRGGTLEKDINLAVGTELARLLEDDASYSVKLTRREDSFVKLGERSKMSNEFGADLFISLHCNANDDRRLSGFEVYFLSERASDPDAERLAEFENSVLALEGENAEADAATELLLSMGRNLDINAAARMAGLAARALGKRVDLRNRGVKQAAFYVLRGTNAPAVLVEMAFVSNARDEAKLQSKKYRRKIIEGIYAGILEFRQSRSEEEAYR